MSRVPENMKNSEENFEAFNTYSSVLQDIFSTVADVRSYAAYHDGFFFRLKGGKRAYERGELLLSRLQRAQLGLAQDVFDDVDVTERLENIKHLAQDAIDYSKKYSWIAQKGDYAPRTGLSVSRLEEFVNE